MKSLNNSYYYKYSILGLNFLCELPWEIEILEEAREFLSLLPVDEGSDAAATIKNAEAVNPDGLAESKVYQMKTERQIERKAYQNVSEELTGRKAYRNAAADYDMFIHMASVDELPPVSPDAFFWQGRLYGRDSDGVRLHMLLTREKPPYACALQKRESRTFECMCLEDSRKYVRYSRHLSDLVGMENIFLQFKALMLHAAFIRWQGKGILFTAPSGTGKSTQAELWKQYEGADIINGDRAGLRKTEEGWTAYGLPYAGSSGIYRNESAPLRTIIILRQAKENSVRKASFAEAAKLLYPETMLHHWDSVYMNEATELLFELIEEVPVYILDCMPDRGAVEAVKDILEADLQSR